MGKNVVSRERVEVEVGFIGVACNRIVNAASWGPCDLVAFGAHHTVAIFSPQKASILATLPGHKDHVNCVEWLPRHRLNVKDDSVADEEFLLSGSADGVIMLWGHRTSTDKWRNALHLSTAHEKSVTCISGMTLSGLDALFVSTSSDGTVRIWKLRLPAQAGGDCSVALLQSINVGVRVMVAVTLAFLPRNSEYIILAMGGLDNQIHLYVGTALGQFVPACELKGHQDWIRSLDFSRPIIESASECLLLASSSQDRNIRLWKITPKEVLILDNHPTQFPSLKMFIEGPVFRMGKETWQVSFESLLVGHEDWVYSVRWQPPVDDDFETTDKDKSLCVLSSSMDRTMMIWRPQPKSGIWMNEVSVGELSHSALGFYGGTWGPRGDSILAHGFSGSFHLWKNTGKGKADWQPQLAPSGHFGPVVDVAWAKNGEFLLSGSHDQTTRVFACWDWSKQDVAIKERSWHEIARPQVHGHDINCIAIVQRHGNHQYASGAEEKVARIFEAPTAFLDTLLCTTGGNRKGPEEIDRKEMQILGANMSALGLSQKPIYAQDYGNSATENLNSSLDTFEAFPSALPSVLAEPPLEEHLAQNTLWPESHKLYGHGNELYSMCSNYSGSLLATACKAQSASVAEIWLWDTSSWRGVGCLQSHTLTITQMEFSHNDHFLLSVSRDRHFSVFQRGIPGEVEGPAPYSLLVNAEAHKRIIWTCSWSHCDKYFATGSRDKSVKIWALVEAENKVAVKHVSTFPLFRSSVTALAWSPQAGSKDYVLAVGLETGLIELWNGTSGDMTPNGGYTMGKLDFSCLMQFDVNLCHVGSVNRLIWKILGSKSDCEDSTHTPNASSTLVQLASCGADHAVRIFNVKLQL
ncbi:hypothetical protein O6H91_17G051700 [Diphasiastrum complanatum]|uniref:Uncharacterized protein n=1 Tax=Diphasiastrum complanatum TaxID=34168 RepID=A0ACC2B6R4_DIPCM|nr:hypothetical protein O6H91_17G051700 [Diphasiastrum complanatum]